MGKFWQINFMTFLPLRFCAIWQLYIQEATFLISIYAIQIIVHTYVASLFVTLVSIAYSAFLEILI